MSGKSYIEETLKPVLIVKDNGKKAQQLEQLCNSFVSNDAEAKKYTAIINNSGSTPEQLAEARGYLALYWLDILTYLAEQQNNTNVDYSGSSIYCLKELDNHLSQLSEMNNLYLFTGPTDEGKTDQPPSMNIFIINANQMQRRFYRHLNNRFQYTFTPTVFNTRIADSYKRSIAAESRSFVIAQRDGNDTKSIFNKINRLYGEYLTVVHKINYNAYKRVYGEYMQFRNNYNESQDFNTILTDAETSTTNSTSNSLLTYFLSYIPSGNNTTQNTTLVNLSPIERFRSRINQIANPKIERYKNTLWTEQSNKDHALKEILRFCTTTDPVLLLQAMEIYLASTEEQQRDWNIPSHSPHYLEALKNTGMFSTAKYSETFIKIVLATIELREALELDPTLTPLPPRTVEFDALANEIKPVKLDTSATSGSGSSSRRNNQG